MAVSSPYRDAARRELWARQVFTFIPDRVLPPPFGTPRRRGDGARVLFAGFPSDYSLAFLLALLDLDVELAGIITSPGAHPAILGDNALSRIADHLGIPILRLWRVNDEHARTDITALDPDPPATPPFHQILAANTPAIP